MSKWVSKDRAYAARNADLYEYLEEYHPEEFYIYEKELRYKRDFNISIPKRSCRYVRFGKYDDPTIPKGNAIDFLVKYLGYSYQEAVIALTGDSNLIFDDEASDMDEEDRKLRHEEMKEMFSGYARDDDIEDEEEEEFRPPDKDDNCRVLYAYLIKTRGIDEEVVRMQVEGNYIYQSRNNKMVNIVFCNKDRDWIEERGTNTYADKRCAKAPKDGSENGCSRYVPCDHYWCEHMHDCPDFKKSSFHRTKGINGGYWAYTAGGDVSHEKQCLYICEAGIDAISLYELEMLKKGEEAVVGHTYITIGGAVKHNAIKRVIQDAERKGIRKDQIYLAVDNDEAGENCRKRYPDLPFIVPENKDWNDDLRDYKGL